MSFVPEVETGDVEGPIVRAGRTCNVIVVGLTGSGKSSIIKALCAPMAVEDEERPLPAVQLTPRSVTKDLAAYNDNLMQDPATGLQYTVNLVDTVGLGDNEISVETILQQIIAVMPTELPKIHKIVFCFKMDRLRASMSEELTKVYNFFKLLGAKKEHFVLCLTFCDILSHETLTSFWNVLKEMEKLPMVRDVSDVVETSFPNLDECDKDEELVKYLIRKSHLSRRRVFQRVVTKTVTPFYPYQQIQRMPETSFDDLVAMLTAFQASKGWFWRSSPSTQQQMITELQRIRAHQLSGKAVSPGKAKNEEGSDHIVSKESKNGQSGGWSLWGKK